ncbi:hypothetical protein FRUB_08904 [Fimbriiglobus ruber]|uniref:DUF262 domain-containing protein n=1 Tax=Fimbriiglobus ruber TaxID=1908690 RepID=A0A225D417_9BACT|nr:hypothetical protein FRUB_08904 [Fimbriiglobus ruber]
MDGKQRLQTLFMFANNEISLPGDFGNDRLDGKSWEQLQPDERQIFWNYVVLVEFLTFNANDPHDVNQAFDRLNRNMRKLEPQELRHARWDGWFIKLVESEAEDVAWQKLGVVTKARTTRMKDVQFISELVLVIIEGKILGFEQQDLDAAYAKYDDPEELEEPIDTDDVKDKISDVKQYLLDMQDTNGCVKRISTNLGVFYTLWAIVSLHMGKLPLAPDLARKFVTFKEAVDTFNDSTEKAILLSGVDAAKYKLAEEFLQGYRANTDYTPRLKRQQALLAYIEGVAT